MKYPSQGEGSNKCGAYALAYWEGRIKELKVPGQIKFLADDLYKMIQFDKGDFLDIGKGYDKKVIIEKWKSVTEKGTPIPEDKSFSRVKDMCCGETDRNCCSPVKMMAEIKDMEAECIFYLGPAEEVKMIYAQLKDVPENDVEKAGFDYETLDADKKALEIVSVNNEERKGLHYLYVFRGRDGKVMAVDPAGKGEFVETVERASLDSTYKATKAAIVIPSA